MKRSQTQPTALEKWTEEDVHRWLMTEVKVQEICAERFVEEEVSGDSLIDFTKADLLDLGIKHGPAVKIMSHLESLKSGLPRDPFPPYVENWTKEQVQQWLLQHVNVYRKYAETLQEQDVSGDCLVCFKKQDFLDLQVKSGPAVKILAKLRQLSQSSEPALEPIPHTSTEQEEAQKPVQPEKSSARTAPSKQEEQQHSTSESQTQKMVGDKSGNVKPQFKKSSGQGDILHPQQQTLSTRRKETLAIPAPPEVTSTAAVIQETLDNLNKEGFKRFKFNLKLYKKSQFKPIPESKLEYADTMDTAKIITDNYGSHEGCTVALEILREIGQHELARQLQITMGRPEQQGLSSEVVKKEGNQGEKLKNLLTCGGNSLDNCDIFVIVVNKSSAEQVQCLQFLNKLKLFCVLDFDPNSNTQVGLCHSYRESRWANLHTPSQYQAQIETVIKSLNLHKQTSWVFCNGRHDLDDDSKMELDYRDWLRKSCRDVEQMVSFICNPEVLPHGGFLIIFLLLSPVDSDIDPIFDTYKAFLKHIEEEMIIHICESQGTYKKWRKLIQEKCKSDIDPQCIYELSLREVNGTVMALGQSPERLLPSNDSSSVVLKEMDKDKLTALDILCLNQCENIYEENSPDFHAKRVKVEEEFYRGGKVNWWNFYFCEKDKEKPFIKRDKYKQVKKTIKSEFRESRDLCVLFNLFHEAGCGGSTLAMHVMWDLRKEVRCAVLRDNDSPVTEVADQVIKLMMLESDRPCPVLLLVDDSKKTENLYELVNCIPQAVETRSNMNMDKERGCKVVILTCVRSQKPKEMYRRHQPSQFITASLTSGEQEEFKRKLDELRETHEKPENFYSFMIMKSNFDPVYINKLAHNSLEDFVYDSNKARLFAFLALLNTYVADSRISRSLCEDFLGMKKIYWQDKSALDRMEPYSNLLIIDRVEDWEGYEGIRILHHSIASACLEELAKRHSLKVSDITLEILHCDLFFSVGVVKKRFMDSVQQMLVVRHHKKDGVGRERFSPFIEKIHSEEGRQTVHQIFEKASFRFEKSASIPQALARYLYIKEQDFPEALKWAEKAKNIKEHPHTLDTIGQIHKSNLKSNLKSTKQRGEKQEVPCSPEDLNTNIEIARKAFTAYKKSQELADTEEEPEDKDVDDESDDYPKSSYNVLCYVGVLEIAFLIFEILGRLPFFDETDPMKKTYLQKFLQKTLQITSVYKEESEENNRYEEIIKRHQDFLQNLKTEVKDTFELLNCYFTYVKESTVEFQAKNHSNVCKLFKDYVNLFCNASEEMKTERQSNPNLNLKINIEEQKLFLEENQADTFSGILQHLDKPADKIERITESYDFLHKQHSTDKKQKTKETINFILANIVLILLKPGSKNVKSDSYLTDLLSKTLQDVGLGYSSPDPYFLALLLFWPSPAEARSEIITYVRAIRKSSFKYKSILFRKRKVVTYFYLGKEDGLKKFISKSQLDERFLKKGLPREALAKLWQKGDIFEKKEIQNRLQRVRGTIEQGEVFASYGKMKVPVRPALISHVSSGLSTEKVSFYLGFAIDGPLAYDIQYEN